MILHGIHTQWSYKVALHNGCARCIQPTLFIWGVSVKVYFTMIVQGKKARQGEKLLKTALDLQGHKRCHLTMVRLGVSARQHHNLLVGFKTDRIQSHFCLRDLRNQLSRHDYLHLTQPITDAPLDRYKFYNSLYLRTNFRMSLFHVNISIFPWCQNYYL